MNTCKECKYFDNSKPIDTIYIGKCEKLHLPLQLNDPLDYIMSRIYDSGIVGDGNYIYFDDLKRVLGEILCFDNMEEK